MNANTLFLGRIILAGLAIAAALIAQGPNDVARAQRGADVVRIPLPSDPIMNPVIGADASAVPFNRFFYDFLTRPDPNTLKPAPGIATGWSVSSDGLAWTFKLVRGARWHDGKPFTAGDVKFTYETVLDPEQNSARRSSLKTIKNIVIVNDNTIRFELSEPFSAFPTIASYNLGIIPKHILQGRKMSEATEFNTKHPISTGPYRMEEAVPGDHYTFVATGNYFGEAPKIKRFVFKIVPDVNAQTAQVKSGDLDYAGIQPTNLPAVKGSANLEIQTVPFMGYDTVSFNYHHPLFRDKRVRQAMIYALNRQGILDSILSGMGTLGTGPIPPLFSWAYNKELEPYPYNPQKAQQLLREAGWTKGSDASLRNSKGELFEFELGVDKGNPTRERIALVAQQAYQDLGMKVNLTVVEWPVYVKQLLGKKWDAYVGFIVLPPDPELTNYFGPGQFYNFTQYDNPKVAELLDQGRRIADLDRRGEIYREMLAVMHDDPPGSFLYYPYDIRVMRKGLKVPELPFREALNWRERWSY